MKNLVYLMLILSYSSEILFKSQVVDSHIQENRIDLLLLHRGFLSSKCSWICWILYIYTHTPHTHMHTHMYTPHKHAHTTHTHTPHTRTHHTHTPHTHTHAHTHAHHTCTHHKHTTHTRTPHTQTHIYLIWEALKQTSDLLLPNLNRSRTFLGT